jgi:molecular chaperone HscB
MLPLRCPHCTTVVDAAAAPLVCPSCAKLLPPHPQVSPFALLEAPRRFHLDEAALERAWLMRSRVVHPDRTRAKDAAERRAAAEQTAALNDAWRLLRVRFERAVVLVKGAGVVEPKLGPAALMAFMEVREEAEDEAARPGVLARAVADHAAVSAAIAADLAVVDDIAGGYDEGGPARPRLEQVAKKLAEARTLARLIDDLGGARRS